jgi:branched-chain amino acid transport system permease protein
VDADRRLGAGRDLRVLVFVLMKSPWGACSRRSARTRTAVRSLGKNVYSYKMQSLILGGVIGTFAGDLALGPATCSPTTTAAT